MLRGRDGLSVFAGRSLPYVLKCGGLRSSIATVPSTASAVDMATAMCASAQRYLLGRSGNLLCSRSARFPSARL